MCGKLDALETGADYEVEFRLTRADGKYLWHLARATAGRDGDGKIIKWFGTNSDIQTQKTAEEKLRESEAWLRTILDGSRDGIVIEDDGKIVYTNKSYAELLCYDAPEELIGRQISELLPPEEARRLTEFGRRRLRGEQVPNIYEFNAKRKDEMIIEVEGAVSTSIVGEKKYIVTSIRDITERKQAREQLRQSVSLLTSTLESTADGILVVCAENKIVTFNRKFAEMWGITVEELGGMSNADAPPRISEQINKTDDYYERIKRIDLRTDESTFDVLELKDGRIYERSSQPQKLNGETVGRVFSFRDATARNTAERQEFESRQMLQLVMDTIPQAIWWKNTESVYLGSNQFLAKLAGFETAEQMIGLTDYEMPWTREESDFFRECDRHVMESGKAELGIVEPQMQADGKQAWLNTNKAPLRDADGKVIGILGTYRGCYRETPCRRSVARKRI